MTMCQKIATTKPDWFANLPGVAVRDPILGHRWRRVPIGGVGGWVADYAAANNGIVTWVRDDELAEGSPDDSQVQELLRALAEGPDYNDPVTINALLGDGSAVGNGNLWQAQIGRGQAEAYARSNAILKAYLYNLG